MGVILLSLEQKDEGDFGMVVFDEKSGGQWDVALVKAGSKEISFEPESREPLPELRVTRRSLEEFAYTLYALGIEAKSPNQLKAEAS